MHGGVLAILSLVGLQGSDDVGRALSTQLWNVIGGVHVLVVGDTVTTETGIRFQATRVDITGRMRGTIQQDREANEDQWFHGLSRRVMVHP